MEKVAEIPIASHHVVAKSLETLFQKYQKKIDGFKAQLSQIKKCQNCSTTGTKKKKDGDGDDFWKERRTKVIEKAAN